MKSVALLLALASFGFWALDRAPSDAGTLSHEAPPTLPQDVVLIGAAPRTRASGTTTQGDVPYFDDFDPWATEPARDAPLLSSDVVLIGTTPSTQAGSHTSPHDAPYFDDFDPWASNVIEPHKAAPTNDPWATDPAVDVPKIDRPSVQVHRVRWSAAGRPVVSRVALNRETTSSASFPLVAYDLRRIAPRGRVRVHGQDEAYDPDRRNDFTPDVAVWWRELLRRIGAETGTSSWDLKGTLLGWDERTRRLFVRHTDRALLTIESIFDRYESHAGALRLVVQTTGKIAGAGGTIELDVPWNTPIRAFEGTRWTYVMDYCVEISMSVLGMTPIFSFVESGVSVQAAWVPSSKSADGELQVEVHWRDAPEFELFESWSDADNTTLSVELPRAEAVRWQGTLPVGNDGPTPITVEGRHIGAVRVQAPRGPTKQNWQRTAVPKIANDKALTIAVRGSVSGDRGAGPVVLLQSRTLVRSPCPTWERLAKSVDTLEESTVGAGYADVLTDIEHTPSGATVDATLTVTQWTGVSRSISVYDYPTKRFSTIDLPVSHAVVISRRAELDAEGGDIEFVADLGEGREQFDLRFRRSRPAPPKSK